MSTSQAEVFLDFVSSAFLLTQHQKTRRTGSLFYTFTKYEQYNIPQANALLRIATQPELQIQLARFIAGAIFVRPTKTNKPHRSCRADPTEFDALYVYCYVCDFHFLHTPAIP